MFKYVYLNIFYNYFTVVVATQQLTKIKENKTRIKEIDDENGSMSAGSEKLNDRERKAIRAENKLLTDNLTKATNLYTGTDKKVEEYQLNKK